MGVKKGCYIGPGKNCDTRRNALKNKIKAAVRKMGVQHGKYARHLHCAAARKKGEMIPMENNKTVGDTYPLPYVYEPEFEITPENFQVENWIDPDTDIFDGCAAFQKIVTTLSNWGKVYDQGCHRNWDDAKKTAWFEKFWKKQVDSFQTFLNVKLSHASYEDLSVFKNCELDNGLPPKPE